MNRCAQITAMNRRTFDPCRREETEPASHDFR